MTKLEIVLKLADFQDRLIKLERKVNALNRRLNKKKANE